MEENIIRKSMDINFMEERNIIEKYCFISRCGFLILVFLVCLFRLYV